MTKFLKFITFVTITGIALMAIAISGAYLYLSPNLPDAETLTHIKLQVPLRIYSIDGKLLGEFGEKKRTPVSIKDIPTPFINAFLAAEDDRFYKHKGFSSKALARAVWQAVSGSDAQTGGSTITMQVVKNYLLTPDRNIIRKLKELFISVQIERFLTKDQILELYLNKIFLGHQAYGVAAAAHVYYGKAINNLTLAEMAMIAALPKAPSSINPISNPTEALIRRNWVLKRMLALKYIDKNEYDIAFATPISTKKHTADIQVDASYAAEMARQELFALYGEEAYTEGYRVVTTINSNLQETAQKALRNGLHAYDLRHGYRKPEAHLDEITDEAKKALFAKIVSSNELEAAIVLDNAGKTVKAELGDGKIVEIQWEGGLSTAKTYISESRYSVAPKLAKDILKVGDVIRVKLVDGNWQLTQIPKAEAALVSLNPHDGSIYAIVGGYGFYNNKFNRATQAKRLIGSNIKPFIYSLALNSGFTAASIIDDAPLIYTNPYTGVVWKPGNDDDKYLGPIRLRQALYKSRNMVSIRILQKLGIKKTVDYLTRFGFERNSLPAEMSLALGTPSFTPIQVATAYATIANQGFKISPYLIDSIYNGENEEVFKASPAVACKSCVSAPAPITKPVETANSEADSMEDLLKETTVEETPQEISEPATDGNASDTHYAERIMDERVVFIIDSILTDTIQKGTARRAISLKRPDIAGKTATTNGPTDSWFSGYHPNIITTVWAGFDDNTPIGKEEYGSTVALPIWIEFMGTALKDQPMMMREPPTGIVSVLINKKTGKRASPGDADAMFEYIQEDLLYTIESEEAKANETTDQIESIF